jgi:hypothetical protein
MLVYAIVLILVMLATNSPQIRNFFSRIMAFIRSKGKPGGDAGSDEAEKEGALNE